MGIKVASFEANFIFGFREIKAFFFRIVSYMPFVNTGCSISLIP